MSEDPTPPSPNQYWLKTYPTNLYLRLYGSGNNDVVLTPAPPKFLRWQEDENNAQIASYGEKRFGLVRSPARAKRGWEKLDVTLGETDDGFKWEMKDGREVLVCEEGQGFMCCRWDLGHPQLFWLTGLGEGEKELPEYCVRVDIVREWLIKRPEEA